MMDKQMVWVDVARCTGCGECVKVCPAGAIALVDGKAHVYEEKCTGCGVCVDACPEGVIQPVVTVQGELVPAPERPAPTVSRPGPLAETTAAAVVVAGTGLLMRAASALARAAGRWLTRQFAGTGPSTGAASRAVGGTGAGRRTRRRRRGR
jgi:ferredoxin